MISIRLYHNYETRKISSGLKIDADYWNFENNCLKNDAPNREHLQYILDEQIQKLRKRELEYKIQGKDYSLDDILGVNRKSVTTVAVYFQKVMPEARNIINKYLKNGKEDEDYIFPILDRHLHVSERQKFDRIQKVRTEVNKSLRVICEAMGHSSEKVTQIYLDSFENEQIDAAMSNLL